MFCTYCNVKRPQNEALCPNCGAPSPLQGQMTTRNWGPSNPQAAAWGNGRAESVGWSPGTNPLNKQWSSQEQQMSPSDPYQLSPATNNQAPQLPFNTPTSMNSWGQFSPSNNAQAPQMPFDASIPENAWGQSSPSSNNQWNRQVPQLSFEASLPQWGTDLQNGAPTPHEPPKSLLPVPYRSQMNLQVEQARNMALPIIQSPSLEQMLPALPEDSVYVPPMYTKPRPIIPRYRIISGILSLLIVSLLFCGGVSYYAKASGKLGTLGRAITGAPPASIESTPLPALPNPPTKSDTGPAYSKIPAATTTLRIDKNNTPLQPTRNFKVNQVFYLTFTVPNLNTGTVTAKWSMNGNYYRTTTVGSNSTRKAPGMVNAWMSMLYETPAEGSVELDWNNQLAQRLYFVVQP